MGFVLDRIEKKGEKAAFYFQSRKNIGFVVKSSYGVNPFPNSKF